MPNIDEHSIERGGTINAGGPNNPPPLRVLEKSNEEVIAAIRANGEALLKGTEAIKANTAALLAQSEKVEEFLEALRAILAEHAADLKAKIIG